MDPATLALRAEIARRLKAARWLAGSVSENDRGKSGYEVAALSPEDLAKREPLSENGITATKIGAMERMERYTPPMELRAIAEALHLPRDWFVVERVAPIRPEVDEITRAVMALGEEIAARAAMRQAPPADTPDTPAQGDTTGEAPGALRRGRLGSA